MVARLPTWEQRLLEEIQSVAGGGPIEPEHIEALNEGTRFFKEAMRLYPPVSSIVRIAAKDTELGGAPIRAGTIIVVAIYAIHRHRSLWNDPDRFDPERFLPENESRQARYQFMPFGAGPRVCLGASFAMVEAIAMFASFIRAARFDIPNGYVPVPLSRVTLRAKGGMPLKVWPRAAAAA
jgi:cytochrome P450